MGGFWSCCRREKSPEKEPLLPKSRPVEHPGNSGFDKLADIVGALNSGKLPSQDQLSGLLQHALRSELLRNPTNTLPTRGGPVGQRGVALIFEIRELVDSLLRIGLEKNYDNRLQDLLYQSAQSSDPVKVSGELLVDGSPVQLDGGSSEEISEDANDFLQSLKTLSRLTLTSSAFRMLMSDILVTTREVIAEGATEIGEVAAQVQAAATDVVKIAELDNLTVESLKGKAEESYSGIQQSVGHAHRNLGTLGDESAEQIRDIMVGRVQEIVIQAHGNPEHQAAMSTILILLRKYSQKINTVAESTEEPVTINTQVDVSTPFYEAAVDFKVLLERFASGRSLDPLIRMFKTAIADVLDAPNETATEVTRYFADLGRWFERALAEPQFAASRLGTRTLEELYDAGRLLLASESNAQWAQDMRLLVGEAQSFAHALESDVATQRLVKAVQSVLSAFRGLTQDTLSAGTRSKWREELLKDTLGWFITRALKSLHRLPMPRVEFQNSTFDVAVDALLLTSASASASLAPDHVWVQNWNEIKIDMTADESSETSSRTRVHIDGMRCAAHGFGYYFKYKGPSILQYSDEGVLDVDVGRPECVGQGLAVDLEIETTQEERDTPGQPLFRLVDVNVSVPGLAFLIKDSKHWILNNVVLQPLAASVVQLLLKRVLEQQIRNAVEWADRMFTATFEEAARINAHKRDPGKNPSLEDYWIAASRTAPALVESRDSGPSVETHTESTFKGIIHTATTLPEDPGATSPVEETVLAVGGGAQLFPNKGGPYGAEEATATEVAREAVEEIHEAVSHAAGKTREVVEAVEDDAVRIRGDLYRAEQRKMDRERFERYRGGWRSHAFDLD